MILGGKMEVLEENLSRCYVAHHKSYGLAWARTGVSVAKSQRQTT